MGAYILLEPDRDHPWRGGADGFWLRLVMYAPLARLPEFLVGMFVGKLFLEDRLRGPRNDGTRTATAGVVGAFALFACHTHLPMPLLHSTLAIPFFAMTTYGLARGAGPWGRVLALPWIVELGRASYSMYVLQLAVALAMLVALGAPPRMGRMSAQVFPE